jgi:hypothetical protein
MRNMSCLRNIPISSQSGCWGFSSWIFDGKEISLF